MGTRLMRQMAERYRSAHRNLVREKKVVGIINKVTTSEDGEESAGQGVRYIELDTAHHLQNDDGWEEGAERLAKFWTQL